MSEVAAFRWVPPFAWGFVRDLRVRWALEEASLPYEAVLIDHDYKNSADYRRWQPFGQVPAYRDGELEMFESGAIVLHLAEQSEALAPRDAAGRARVTQWVLAALNTIEPHVQQLAASALFHRRGLDKERRPQVEQLIAKRLAELDVWLEGKDYLEGRFTAGDLIMTTVLRELVDSDLLKRFPQLDAYRRRCGSAPLSAAPSRPSSCRFAKTRPGLSEKISHGNADLRQSAGEGP